MARRPWTERELVEGIRAGDRRALARAITLIENRAPEGATVVQEIFPETGRASVVGVTGSPGSGKSTLVGALTGHVRSLDRSVGVLSVDPSSPFSNGALLGDRIRLTDHFLDPQVFIRSMGARGHLGGLAEATLQSLFVLDAAGTDVVFLETVGTGQSDVEVAGIADVVLLVLMPGAGDAVQALKAGIMEIPDVIAINKMDHPGAGSMVKDVRSIVALDPDPDNRPSILLTDAVRDVGIEELWDAVEARRESFAASGALVERRRRNLETEVLGLAAGRIRETLVEAIRGDAAMGELVAAVGRREVDPVTAVRELLARVTGNGAADPR